MMMIILLLLGLAVLTAMAGEPDKERDAGPDHPRVDSRFTRVFDLDHPDSFTPSFRSREEWENRAKKLREQVLVSQGLWPMPERSPLSPVIHGRIDREGYTVEKVFFESTPGHFVSGSLYRPTGTEGRRPGVLCPHGHWANGRFYENSEESARKEIEIGAEATMEGARYPLQARCAMLARMGCVVFHYDMVGNADSAPIGHREGFTDVEAELRMQSFMGLQTWNSIRALDFIAGLPDVDPKRIAVTGASGGGTQTFLLCAVDDRPAAAFPAVMVSTAMQGGCVCENSSHLRVGTNNIEIAALFAPKPLGMTGANDWTREIETKGLPELKTIYGLYRRDEYVDGKYFSFEHNYNRVSRERMYGWMNRHLRLGWPEPVVEKPFVPIDPEDLSVFDTDHPRPAGALDSAALRQKMTGDSDRHMAALAKSPSEYRRVLRVALHVLLHDELPGRNSVRFDAVSAENGDGYRLERGWSHGDDRSPVPSVLLTPDGWNGRVAIWIDPRGKGCLFDAVGKPEPSTRVLLERKMAVLSGDLLGWGESVSPDGVAPAVSRRLEENGKAYAGFVFGYNRALLAERSSDILTLLAAARSLPETRSVWVAGMSRAGLPAMLASALAGDAVSGSVLDLDQFDFQEIELVTDERMLPGAVKYGGIFGFASLLEGKPVLHHAPARSVLPPNGRWEVQSNRLEPIDAARRLAG